MSDTPLIPQKKPYPVSIEAGTTYWWCACGRSARQPFCDGSHKGTAFAPVKFVADEDGMVFFCGCKATQNAPHCDSSHGML